MTCGIFVYGACCHVYVCCCDVVVFMICCFLLCKFSFYNITHYLGKNKLEAKWKKFTSKLTSKKKFPFLARTKFRTNVYIPELAEHVVWGRELALVQNRLPYEFTRLEEDFTRLNITYKGDTRERLVLTNDNANTQALGRLDLIVAEERKRMRKQQKEDDAKIAKLQEQLNQAMAKKKKRYPAVSSSSERDFTPKFKSAGKR